MAHEFQTPHVTEIVKIIDEAELHDDRYFEDERHRIEEEVRADIEEDAQYTGASAEECAALYAEWMKKYNRPRPNFKA